MHEIKDVQVKREEEEGKGEMIRLKHRRNG